RLGIAPRGVEAALDALPRSGGPRRARLTVAADGQAEATAQPYTPLREGRVWTLGLWPQPLRAGDPWLRVKTTRRGLYDRARAALPEGVDEWVFLNADGEVCEGTITNIFADPGDGMLTPPLECGLLPGVLREEVLAQGRAREARLRLDDLRAARRLYAGNSLRGLIPARLVM
uniref:aminotransferase class IV n=1 Tax=Roseovarius salinarum TaxID=1981892 RepID=UPI000C337342